MKIFTHPALYGATLINNDEKEHLTAQQIKEKYKRLPPTIVVVTGREPHIRMHMWWKITEATNDSEELRELLEGVQTNLGGDPAVKNPTSLMRLAGSVNWQTEKKRAKGRKVEMVEIKTPDGSKPNVYTEALLLAYPAGAGYQSGMDYEPVAAKGQASPISGDGLNLNETLDDGREAYMHQMLCATIVHLTEERGRWPTHDEVFNDAWPVYSTKVRGRYGRTLEQDDRGQRLMHGKIKSKLSAFTRGRVRGAESIEKILAAKLRGGRTGAEASGDSKQNGQEEQKEKPGRRRFQPYSVQELQTLPDVEPLIKKVIDRHSLSVMFGPPNCGKTFKALDMALHIAMGFEWRGHKTRQGKVFYIAAEAGFGIKKRLQAFSLHHKLDSIPNFFLLPKGVNFCETQNDAQEVIKEIKILGDGVEYVVVDTLARAMAGGNENGPEDMGRFVTNCDLIRQSSNVHVMIVHHTGKSEAAGARGHSSLLAAIDTEIAVTNTDGVITAEITKQRDGGKGERFCSTIKVIDIGTDGDGDPVTSCVLIPMDAPPAGKRKLKLSKSENRAMQILHNLAALKGEKGIPKSGMPTLTFVRLDDFRKALKDGNISASTKPDSVNTAIKRAIENLNNKEITATWEDKIWAVGQNRQ